MDATLEATVTRILTDHEHAPGLLWETLEEHGLTQILLARDSNSSADTRQTTALCPQDYFGLLQATGQTASGLRLCEHLLARWLLDCAGIKPPGGKLSVVSGDKIVCSNGATVAENCVFGSDSDYVVWLNSEGSDRQVSMASIRGFVAQSSVGVEPTASVTLNPVCQQQTAPPWLDPLALQTMGALMRACQISGALSAILELTLLHAAQRTQFGRALDKFQAIQHMLAAIAGESAAATAAVNKAIDEFRIESLSNPGSIASAKIRTSEAVNTVTAHAHQIHGALGYTEEYALAKYTRRLWQWRDDFGCEYTWSEFLGKRIIQSGKHSEHKQHSALIDALLGEIDE